MDRNLVPPDAGAHVRYHRHELGLKLRLIEAWLRGDDTMKTIARQHGVSATLLKIWVEKYKRGDFDGEIVSSVRAHEFRARLAAIEQRVTRLEAAARLPQPSPPFASEEGRR